MDASHRTLLQAFSKIQCLPRFVRIYFNIYSVLRTPSSPDPSKTCTAIATRPTLWWRQDQEAHEESHRAAMELPHCTIIGKSNHREHRSQLEKSFALRKAAANLFLPHCRPVTARVEFDLHLLAATFNTD